MIGRVAARRTEAYLKSGADGPRMEEGFRTEGTEDTEWFGIEIGRASAASGETAMFVGRKG